MSERQVKIMRVDGIDPVHLNKVQDQTQKPLIQESKQDPKHKQQERVLGREQKVGDWDRTHVEELEEALKKVNEAAETFNTGLRFRVHEESERMMVQVVDRTTSEVIREIPPEKVLNLVAQIQDLIGVFIDARR